MCTILFFHRVREDFPLIVAANRDEHFARPSTPPRLLTKTPRVLAGLDQRAGGTWLGVNEHGLLVGLTNERTYRPPNPSLRSRGEVVSTALRARSVSECLDYLRTLDAADYNAFNLLIGDGRTLHAAYSRTDAHAIEIEVAPTGVHVLPNARLGASGFPKTERARERALALTDQPWPALVSGLASVLGDHTLADPASVPAPPRDSPFDHALLQRMECMCLHGHSYGTCSAAIIALRPGEVAHYLYANGPACTTPFEDMTMLLRAQ